MSCAEVNANVNTKAPPLPFAARAERRNVNYEKHGDPSNRHVVTGYGRKTMTDVIVTTQTLTGPLAETFTVHKHRGEWRVSIVPLAENGPRESLDLDDFVKYAVKRWKDKAGAVLDLVAAAG